MISSHIYHQLYYIHTPVYCCVFCAGTLQTHQSGLITQYAKRAGFFTPLNREMSQSGMICICAFNSLILTDREAPPPSPPSQQSFRNGHSFRLHSWYCCYALL